jgi:hypothetical protein
MDYIADTHSPEGLLHNETISIDAPIIPTTPQDYVDILQEFTATDKAFTGIFFMAPVALGVTTSFMHYLISERNEWRSYLTLSLETLTFLGSVGFSVGSMFYEKKGTEINQSQHTQAVIFGFTAPILLAHKFSNKKMFSCLKE